MLSQENMYIFTKTPNFAVFFVRVLLVCPPRLYSRTCQYPKQKGKFLNSIETIAQRCSVKKVFLEISQYSPENTCVRVSILIKLQTWGPEACNFIKKETPVRFPVKFAKFLRTLFLTESLWWLLLRAPNFVSVPRLCTVQNTLNSSAKADLRTPFLQNSSLWLLSNVSYFFKKGKTETIFHTSSDLNALEVLQLHRN